MKINRNSAQIRTGLIYILDLNLKCFATVNEGYKKKSGRSGIGQCHLWKRLENGERKRNYQGKFDIKWIKYLQKGERKGKKVYSRMTNIDIMERGKREDFGPIYI
jgi:hypothetical protein